MTAVRLAALHPEWQRPCSLCERFVFRDDGLIQLSRRTGEPERREPHQPTPCHKCPKVPYALRASGADTRACRAAAAEPTDANRQTLRFYRECKAVGDFPADPLVRWFAGVIRGAEDAAERDERARLVRAVDALTERLGKTR